MTKPLALLAISSLAVSAPEIAAGPDLAERATAVEAPIREVTVYSDRARVRRRVSLQLGAGAHALRFPDLPGGAFTDTLRVGATGATVRRVEARTVVRERLSIAQADALIDRFEKLIDEVALVDAEISALDLQIQALSEVAPALPAPEGDRDPNARPKLLPEVWKRAMDFLDEGRGKARAKKRELAIKKGEGRVELAKLTAEIQRLDLGAFSDEKIEVLAIVELARAGPADFELEYVVPGALWKPTYDLSFDDRRGAVELRTSGLVGQATGEPWEDVELHLSTAMPGRGIEMPELLTWTLGEAKTLVPRPRPKVPRMEPPAPPSVSAAARAKRGELDALEARISALKGLAGVAAVEEDAPSEKTESWKKTKTIDFGDVAIGGELSAPEGSYLLQKPPSAPPPMTADEPMSESTSIRVSSRSRSFERPAVMTSLALFDPAPEQGPTLSDPTLPAVAAGGLDYVYPARARAKIPSDGSSVKTPLAVESYPVSAYYEATPSLEATAFLEATVENASGRPILTGPVSIFLGDKFAAEGTLDTTGPGGSIELPLGADRDIRLSRKVIPETRREGVFKKSDVTRYRVIIEVGNFKKRGIRIGITEPLPKTHNDEIEIELKETAPRPSSGPDEHGMLRWVLDVPPGRTETIELCYEIDRPADWRLYQP